jgi:hypothetical protein
MKPIYLLLTVLSIMFSNSLVASGVYAEPPSVYRDVELQQQLKIKRERERAAWELEERRAAEEQARAAEERRIAEERARAAREPEERRAASGSRVEKYSPPITTHPSTTAGTSEKSSLGLPATPLPSNPARKSYNSNVRGSGSGCGSRGGPGYRLPSGKCASWKD